MEAYKEIFGMLHLTSSDSYTRDSTAFFQHCLLELSMLLDTYLMNVHPWVEVT